MALPTVSLITFIQMIIETSILHSIDENFLLPNFFSKSRQELFFS